MSTKRKPTVPAKTTEAEVKVAEPTVEETQEQVNVESTVTEKEEFEKVESSEEPKVELETGNTEPSAPVVTEEEDKQVEEKEVDSVYPFVISDELSAFIDQVVEKEPIVGKVLVDDLVSYISSMSPGKMIDNQFGANEQRKFYRVIRKLLETSNDNFHMMYALLLKFADEFSDSVFNGRYVYRFINETSLNQEETASFLAFVNMITTTAPVKGREHTVKQINFTKTLSYLPDDAKQRVIAFYQL